MAQRMRNISWRQDFGKRKVKIRVVLGTVLSSTRNGKKKLGCFEPFW